MKMKKFIRRAQAELIKMKHTFLFPLHTAMPVLASGIVLLYYRYTRANELGQITAFLELIAIALPFVISIVCAENIGLEEQNHFQVFLGGYQKKWQAFAVKCIVLIGLGVLAIAGAIILFGLGYHFLLNKEGLAGGDYLLLSVFLFFGSIPLYLEHVSFSLLFSKTASECIGVVETIFSALMLTGLGNGRWQFFPCTWSARGIGLMANTFYREEMSSIYLTELEKTVLLCPLLLLIICVIIGIRFHYYEGRQCDD